MLKKIQNLDKDWNYNKRIKLQKIRHSKTLAMCERCYAFYYKNSWHLERPPYLTENREDEVPVFFTQCTSCLKQEESLYEAESNLIFG